MSPVKLSIVKTDASVHPWRVHRTCPDPVAHEIVPRCDHGVWLSKPFHHPMLGTTDLIPTPVGFRIKRDALAWMEEYGMIVTLAFNLSEAGSPLSDRTKARVLAAGEALPKASE